VSKLLIFNFDGTSNEAEDAEQTFDKIAAVNDENITNILKFHLLCGGDLKQQEKGSSSGLTGGQKCFYYSGVGTYGNFFQRLYNSGLSKEKFDVAKILWMAKQDFAEYYQPGDRVLVTGFSRGAALARRFASIINDRVSGKDIIEAVFDTVASIGLPNMNKSDRPKTEVVFENGHTLPGNVLQALHCLSLDDKRKAFQPTLMNREDKIREIWFAGAHSDVGGGFYYDGLADISLRYMLNWIDELEWAIDVISPGEVNYDDLLDSDAGFKISHDDVSIDPNVFGKNHQQSRTPLIGRMTLTDRVCCMVENDELSSAQPTVHHSVAERIAGDRNYVPQSLKGVPHKIEYDDASVQHFNGMLAHKENILNRLKILAVADESTTVALAHNLYNHTGIFFEIDKEYEISVKPVNNAEQQWRDAGIACDANGWDRDDVKLGWKEFAIAGMEPFRRVAKADWFCLCGSIGNNDDSAFTIGKKSTIKAAKTGELCLFANDLNRFYGNNFGKLTVTVKRLS
jgi:hypothetical protein